MIIPPQNPGQRPLLAETIAKLDDRREEYRQRPFMLLGRTLLTQARTFLKMSYHNWVSGQLLESLGQPEPSPGHPGLGLLLETKIIQGDSETRPPKIPLGT